MTEEDRKYIEIVKNSIKEKSESESISFIQELKEEYMIPYGKDMVAYLHKSKKDGRIYDCTIIAKGE